MERVQGRGKKVNVQNGQLLVSQQSLSEEKNECQSEATPFLNYKRAELRERKETLFLITKSKGVRHPHACTHTHYTQHMN